MTNHEGLGQSEPLATGAALARYAEQQVEQQNPLFGDPVTRAYVSKLAERLGDDGVVPIGYITANQLLQYDCQTGKDGFTGAPMPSELTGYPPQVYTVLGVAAKAIGEQAFGEEFGAELQRAYDELAGPQQA